MIQLYPKKNFIPNTSSNFTFKKKLWMLFNMLITYRAHNGLDVTTLRQQIKSSRNSIQDYPPNQDVYLPRHIRIPSSFSVHGRKNLIINPSSSISTVNTPSFPISHHQISWLSLRTIFWRLSKKTESWLSSSPRWILRRHFLLHSPFIRLWAANNLYQSLVQITLRI